MNNARNNSVLCFVSIAIIAATISVFDPIVRAFFYEQSPHIIPYLPLMIGSLALCLIAITKRFQNHADTEASQTNTAGIRRVRVTGTIK